MGTLASSWLEFGGGLDEYSTILISLLLP